MSISNESRGRIKQVFEPIALGMGRLGLTPDGLTLIGFGITVAGAALLAAQSWLLGGIVVFVGGAFDMFDGTLARATGKVSPLGAFMDSVFDRAGEVIVYLGIVAGLLRDGIWDVALLAAAAMGAAVMVSYTRSKSEGLGFTEGTGMAAVGIMPREIRLVILAIGLILAGVLGVGYGDFTGDGGLKVWPGTWALTLALGIITLGSVITVIQRILHVRRQAKTTTTPTP
jgi:CDP-diacylglycerol---glycerol-3-phosphate 3-phosphatidyltransferase